MFEVSDMKMYRGSDIPINDNIIVVNPTLSNIIDDFDEQEYFNAVHMLCASGADLKWQLWDNGIDYTKISDYELFLGYTRFSLGNRKKQLEKFSGNGDLADMSEEHLNDLDFNPLCMTLKYSDGTPIDLADFNEYHREDTDENILYNVERDVVIDRFVFSQIVDVVRKLHFLKRNNEIPGNKTTKMILIEDAKEEAMRNKDKPFESVLLPMISGLSVKCGQCGDENFYKMSVYALITNIKRAFKIQDATLLLQGAYSGFSSLKNVDKKRLDWLSPL